MKQYIFRSSGSRQVVNLTEGNMFYFEKGARELPDIILIHGVWHNSNIMKDFATLLSGQYHVICIDMPNHYKKDTIQCEESIEEYARLVHLTVLELIEKNVCKERPHIHGWSMGGTVSMKVCATYGEFYSQLVLYGASHIWSHFDFPMIETNFQRLVFMTIGYLYKAKYVKPQRIARCILNITKNTADIKCCIADNQILKETNLIEDLKHIKNETYLVVGSLDNIVTAHVVKEIKENIDNLKHLTITNVGHMAVIECPEIVIDFLSETGNLLVTN